MRKCLYQSISQSTSIEGIKFMELFEREHPEFNFRTCKGCSGFQGYTPYESGVCDNYKPMEKTK